MPSLTDIFKKPEGEKPENFWSLVISRAWVEAGIWRVVGEKTEVVARGEAASWQDPDSESLVTASDSTLSAATGSIEEEIEEPNKVVFGLPPSWVEDGQIKPERLELLKKVSKELELTPSGFVVIPEAIVHFLKVKEGAPPNAILVGLSEDSLDVALVQTGRILGSVEVSRSMSPGADVAEGLARLPSISQYPSRILLYDHRSVNLDEARQNLLDNDWKETKISFLHMPKVEILEDDVGISAVSLAGGAEVGSAKSIVLADEDKEVPSTAIEEPVSEAETVESQEDEEQQKIDEESEVVEVNPEELGFLKGVDIAQKPFDFGHSAELSRSPQGKPEIKEGVQVPETVPEKRSFFPTLPSIGGSLPRPSLPKIEVRAIAIIAVGLALLLIGGGIAYWYVPKAHVTVYVAPKKLEKTLEFTVNPSLSVVDNTNKIVPGKIVEVNVSGEKTAGTSGSKTVGEHAKGEVTILHVGGSSILKSSTILTGPNNLKFTLNEDVSVASGSSITNPSKKAASVTAADIGAQYNLASNSEFSVGNFSKADFVAQNDKAFSGGTSRTVPATSEEDRAKLQEGLYAELLEKGTEELKGKMAEKEVLLAQSASFITQDSSFSHKLGEETTTLKLTASGKVKALVVFQDGLTSLIEGVLASDVPDGYLLRQDQVEVVYKKAEVLPEKSTSKTKETPKTDTNKFVAQITANLLPKVNPDEIASAISGKYPAIAKQYLATIPGFARSEVSQNITLPGRLGTLPRISSNIVVEVAAER